MHLLLHTQLFLPPVAAWLLIHQQWSQLGRSQDHLITTWMVLQLMAPQHTRIRALLQMAAQQQQLPHQVCVFPLLLCYASMAVAAAGRP